MASELNGNHVLSKMFHRSVRYSFFGFFTVMLNTAVDGGDYRTLHGDSGHVGVWANRTSVFFLKRKNVQILIL